MANDSRRARRSFAKCCRPACPRKVRAKRDISNPTEPDLASCLVYIDANKNGRYDDGEIFARTNAGGDFTLALAAAGHYRVAVALPSGYTHTSAAYFDLTIHTHAQAIARFALTQIDLNDTIGRVTVCECDRRWIALFRMARSFWPCGFSE